jgi:glycine cleavage system aminomethyltransferase T
MAANGKGNMVPEQSLEQLLSEHADPLHLLRHRQTGPNVYPVVAAEYTNWRDEQRSWQETCILFNQSYHMADIAVRGPDAFAMLNSLGVNSFGNFRPGVAKQFVTCNYDGYVIGDAILFYLGEEEFNIVGREPALHWVQFHAETGGWNVQAEYDERSA